MTTLICLALVLLSQLVQVFSLDCNLLTNSSEEKNVTANNLMKEFDETEMKELVSCLATIGQAPLDEAQSKNVWNSLKKVSRLCDLML